MERADLLEANGGIFSRPGPGALRGRRPTTSRSLVIGNPANTNALIADDQRAGPHRRSGSPP